MMDLTKIESPIILRGDQSTAYRDPAILYHNHDFHLFYSLVEIEDDDYIFSYTAVSTSSDLLHWTPPRKLTLRDQLLNFSSPGNVIRFQQEWWLCLQTYPRPGYTVDQIPRYGDQTSRIFIMRSIDLVNWSKPEILLVKGPQVHEEEMGRMIDPYLVQDKDQSELWWCFYKQNGVSLSSSTDLENWTYRGNYPCGENVCVLAEDNQYILFHSPSNGIGIKRSTDLVNWHDWGQLVTLGQKDWSWARGRITAGTVVDLRRLSGVEKYLMFYHGSGPETEKMHFDNHASIGIAWSRNLLDWSWPGQQ